MQVRDGQLILAEGITSCHEARKALCFPKELPLTVWSSAQLTVDVMNAILDWVRTTTCELIVQCRDDILAVLLSGQASM